MQEHFSIREYASRMRGVNMVKSWPFADSTAEQTVDSLLPPITVEKFTWWVDELEYSPSVTAIFNVGNSKKKKKRVVRNGGAYLSGVEDVEESDTDVRKEGLGLVKAPKKRSILEIFAAADQKFDGVSVNSKWDLKGKRNGKISKGKKKNKEIMLSKNKKKARDINFKKYKKRRGDNIVDTLVPNKEKCLKLKSQTQDAANRNLNPLYNNESEYGIHDYVSTHKRKSSPHDFDADKKTMAHKAYKLMTESQHQILPVRGILKNHSKVISVQNSTKSILQEPIQLNHGKQNEKKHVAFSEKNDMTKLGRNSLLSKECSEESMLNGSNMDAVAASFCEDVVQWIRKDTTLGKISGNEELSNGIQQEIYIGHSCEELLPCHRCWIDTNNHLKKHKMDEYFSRSVTSDQDILHGLKKYLFEAPQIPVHAYPPGFFCTPLECFHTQNMKMMYEPSDPNSGSLVEDLCSNGSRFRQLCLEDYLDAGRKPSVSYLYDEGGICNMSKVSSQSKMENLFPHLSPYQTFPNLSPKEYMHPLCSSTNGNQQGYLCEERSIYGLTESFLGLPLTLRGELIKFNSSADLNFCQMKSSMTADSSSSLSTHSHVILKSLGNHSDCRNWDGRTSVDQLNLCPFEDNLKASPLVPLNLEFSKCQSNGKGNFGLGFIKMGSFQLDKSKNNQNNQIQKFI